MLRVLPWVVDRYWIRNCSLVSSWKISVIRETVVVVGVIVVIVIRKILVRAVVVVRSIVEIGVVIVKLLPTRVFVVPAVQIRRFKAIAILCEDSKTYVKAVERKRNTEKALLFWINILPNLCSSDLMFASVKLVSLTLRKNCFSL